MRFISLFAGIGGLDIGLERAGHTCVAQIESDPYCTRILEQHWPDVPRWGDIHDVSVADLPDTDAVVGGFPCQPVSLAGRRDAQDDPRWLWPEFYQIVRTIRPRYVVVENVAGLASAGMGDVLGDLAAVGYDAEWQSIPAAAVGAPHLRWRIFIVAYPDAGGRDGRTGQQWEGRRPEPKNRDRWAVEPDLGRMATRISRRVDRLRGLGNAVVPQVAEWVGRLLPLDPS